MALQRGGASAPSGRVTRSRLILIPTYAGHLSQTLRLVSSVVDHAVDGELMSMRLVVGQRSELVQFDTPLQKLLGGSAAATWDIGLEHLEHILAHFGVEPPASFSWHPDFGGKFVFQFLKKLYAARYFAGYTTLLVVDADLSFVRPSLSMRELFDAAAHDGEGEPSVVLLPLERGEAQKPVYTPCLKMIGATLSPFLDRSGRQLRPWGLQTWFWRRRIVGRLFDHVETLHADSFLNVSLRAFSCAGRGHCGDTRCYESSLYWAFAALHNLTSFRRVTAESVGRDFGPLVKAQVMKQGNALEMFGTVILGHVECKDAGRLREFLETNSLLFLRFADASNSERSRTRMALRSPPWRCRPPGPSLECAILDTTWAVAHFDARFWGVMRSRCNASREAYGSDVGRRLAPHLSGERTMAWLDIPKAGSSFATALGHYVDGDELLAAMGKVTLPEEEYEALLVDAIVNGATPDN